MYIYMILKVQEDKNKHDMHGVYKVEGCKGVALIHLDMWIYNDN